MSDIQPTDQENLEDQTALEGALRKTGSWFSENITTVIYALAAVLAIAAVVVFLQRQPAGDVEATQALVETLQPQASAEQFQDIADRNSQSALGRWSRLKQAEMMLEQGITSMADDREEAAEELEDARDAFDELGNVANLDDDLRQRVLIGLARVAETECDGSEDSMKAAEAAWQRLLTEFPETLVKGYAEARVERLSKPETAEFYQWFASLDPKPAFDGPGSAVPNIPDPDGLLKNGFPGIDLGADPTEKESTEEAAGDESPPSEKADDAKATEDKPEQDMKSEEAAKAESGPSEEEKTESEEPKTSTEETASKESTEAKDAKAESKPEAASSEETPPEAAAKKETAKEASTEKQEAAAKKDEAKKSAEKAESGESDEGK